MNGLEQVLKKQKNPPKWVFLRCYSAISAEKICHLVTSKRRFTGEGPNEAQVTALTCSTPGLVQSHTPLVKVWFKRVKSAALKVTL
jgi:hypothetical protein